MPSLRDLLPSVSEMPRTQLRLLVFAAIVAISLLSFYVHLLHESLVLGEQMRERQRSTASTGATKLVVRRQAPNLVAARGR